MILRGKKPVFTQLKGDMKTHAALFREDWNRQAQVLGRPDGVYIQAHLSDGQGHLAVECLVLGGGE